MLLAAGWLGEIAPLPGFSEETIEQAQEQAIEWLTNWWLFMQAAKLRQESPLMVIVILPLSFWY